MCVFFLLPLFSKTQFNCPCIWGVGSKPEYNTTKLGVKHVEEPSFAARVFWGHPFIFQHQGKMQGQPQFWSWEQGAGCKWSFWSLNEGAFGGNHKFWSSVLSAAICIFTVRKAERCYWVTWEYTYIYIYTHILIIYIYIIYQTYTNSQLTMGPGLEGQKHRALQCICGQRQGRPQRLQYATWPIIQLVKKCTHNIHIY